ncbi:hypothetical protein ABFV05_007088 [Capra hircus]
MPNCWECLVTQCGRTSKCKAEGIISYDFPTGFPQSGKRRGFHLGSIEIKDAEKCKTDLERAKDMENKSGLKMMKDEHIKLF